MNRLPRALCVVALSSSAAVSLTYAQPAGAAPARVQVAAAEPAPADNAAAEAPAPEPQATEATPDDAAPATPAPADAPAAPQGGTSSLAEQVDAFIHYARTHNYAMAQAAGEQIISSGGDPKEITQLFEAATKSRRLNLDEWLTRQQGIEQLKDVTTRLRAVLQGGYKARSQDVAFIQTNIERLDGTERGRQLATQQLQESGELAVALMLQYLQDPAQARLHFRIRQALPRLGRVALAPLAAATEARDPNVLIPVVSALGELGYDEAAPYLARLVARRDVPPSVKDVAARTLQNRFGVNAQGADVSQLFYNLAEKLYNDNASFKPDPRGQTATIWNWDGRGLRSTAVPTAIYNEVLAMRAAEEAMRLGNTAGDALSLWLAANIKREVESPAGEGAAADAGQPDAHYYNVSAGAQYVNNVLARSLRDGNSAVALRAIRSLQEIVGPSNLFSGQGGEPLLDALEYRGDRNVRTAAAIALAEARPRQAFRNQELVVPLLAEAMGQTGKPNVVVIAGSEAERARLAGELKDFNVAAGVGVQPALAQARNLPSIDVIVVARDIRQSDVDGLMALANQDMRVGGAAKVILQTGRGGPMGQRAITDRLVNVSTANDAAGGLTQAVQEALQRASGQPADEQTATAMATRAAHLLRDLAISRNEVLNVANAEQALLATLNDQRPEIVRAAGEVLALIDSPRSQPALASIALEDKTPDEVKVSLLNSLALSAKQWGNRLEEPAVNALRQLAAGSQNLDVRSAAAEALGALNLPNAQARQLILQRAQQQAKAGQPAAEQPAQEQPQQ